MPVFVILFRWKRVAISTDEISRIIFPMGFAVFNIAYWVYYLYMIAVSIQ